MKLFFLFRNYLQNSQNILFSFPSNLSHLYLSFHASWSLRFLLVGGGVSDAVLISLSSDDCFPVLFLKCLPLGFFVCFKAFSTFWYDPKKKKYTYFSESDNFTYPEDQWGRKLLILDEWMSVKFDHWLGDILLNFPFHTYDL